MSVDFYILRNPNKNFQAIGRDGRPVWVGQATYLCKVGEEDGSRYPWDPASKRAANLLQGRITKAENAYGSVSRDWPRIAATGFEKNWKPKDGDALVVWPEAQVTEADCNWKVAGRLRLLPGRDGSKNWVVFPTPRCRYCEDTGRMTSTIETIPPPGTVGIYAEKGDTCPWCEGPVAVMRGQEKWHELQEEREAQLAASDRTAKDIREEERRWYSTDSSGL